MLGSLCHDPAGSVHIVSHEYESVKRVVCGAKGSYYEGATFVPVCQTCYRFVRADVSMKFQHDTITNSPNATCSKCGRTKMLFEGFI